MSSARTAIAAAAVVEDRFDPPLKSSSSPSRGNGAKLQRLVWEQNEIAKEGGLRFTNEAELKKQRGIALEIVKNLGSSLMEGTSLISTSLPITLFEPRSFLERMADLWAHAPLYLSKAASITNDPVERLKYVITFAISGLYLLTTAKKPFNPILGETYQAQFDDGTEVFVEQVTHHPPSSNFELAPKDGSYLFSGYCTWNGSTRANTIKGTQRGPCNVDFASDDARVTYELPDVLLKGLMWGDRVTELCNTMTFTDAKNGLEAEVTFNPSAQGFVRSLFSKAKESADTIRGEIYRLPNSGASASKKNRDVVSTIEGSWLSHIEFDGKRLWDIKTVPCGVFPHPSPLPSDCRFRADLVALLAGDLDRAKEAKSSLEDLQRQDKKLRQQGKKDGATPTSPLPDKKKKSKK